MEYGGERHAKNDGFSIADAAGLVGIRDPGMPEHVGQLIPRGRSFGSAIAAAGWLLRRGTMSRTMRIPMMKTRRPQEAQAECQARLR
ncbi:hypothetical protein WJ0W_001231 [Paenibacillus melissococcoides]|uniref:Transposase n=1 Tax=Paenibacillus melissococcoides TaxID=2912268 RepID=A0ABN8TYY9_9BACL|nr:MULTISPECIES: hypothetical protein [Paenibacillus]MEB9896962.1 hypothetical protein [Bacillus cereus]CAH8243992.1 hypothetical protein WJ0W_001231 [Paenibacillus melissococcoides]CAH8704072.1 hypothetical protein HTL2_000427 [Paenibacillus melissococcoides]CAH8706769.1 hypothetical protein WDD9_001389 [Paenibacillus melissococcoides]